MFGGSEAADQAADCEPSRPSEKDSRVSALSGAAKYKSMSPARLPISRAPCLTIPPGLSPTTLLDSPVLLTNVKVEPSPTTGTFSIPSIVSSAGHDLSVSPIGSPNSSSSEEGCSDDFEFKPRSMVGLSTDQPLRTLPPIEIEQRQFAVKACNQYNSEISTTSCVKPESEYAELHGLASSLVSTLPERGNSVSVASSEVPSNKMQCLNQSIDDIHASQMDNKVPDVLNSTEKTMEDGYNWRKYGQKHVKGSEFPRSYYKCTHPNCQVKKQLERSHDGQVTDIIYKGKHDHPKPLPSRKLGIGASLCGQEEERIDALSSSVSGEDRGSKVGDQKCSLNVSIRISELSPILEANDNVGPAEISSNKYDEIADEDDDPEAKRRKIDNCSIDVTAMNKINREPRVVIQTLSEVDILDDGYRWRKYGQKVVKGNPNPRSYYKCTNVGCPVRKHVERASHDPKAVITTYEGKHNHDVPAARTSSHDTAASMTINSGGTIYGCITVPMAYEGVRPPSHNFNQCDESDSISLDLGVGLSPRQKDGSNHQSQIPALERGHSMEIDSSNSGCSNLVIPPVVSASYYGVSNSGTNYTGESFSFAPATIGHPSDPYKVNMGNLLMGP